MLDVALSQFGLTAFRPGQLEVIDAVLAGKPTIAVLPTGAGKSLCYQLPAVALGGLTIVVSPLISLMKDQVDALAARGIPATLINSSVDASQREARLRQAVSGELRLLYVAPERFRAPDFIERLRRAPISLFAVDEAHCISEWGHDFRPEYARLSEVVAALHPPRLVALTATATPDVRQEIAARLGMGAPTVFVRGFDRPNLSFAVLPVGGKAEKLAWVMELLKDPALVERPALVYVSTRKHAEEVAAALERRKVPALAYHAGLSDEERGTAQDRFMNGRARVVVATNAFGMGVDKSSVGLVVHYDLPGSLEAYYQEAGRAGRDGRAARCVLLFNHGDVRLREFLIENHGDGERSAARVEAERARLSEMVRYAYAHACRRRFLLEHFGDPAATLRCGGEILCDACHQATQAVALSDDDQLLVRKVLATVARVHGRFGRGRVALALTGSTAAEVRDAGLDQLSTFGLLRDRPLAWVMDLLAALQSADLLATGGAEYPVIGLTALGGEVMHDRQRARLSFSLAELPSRPVAARERRTRQARAPAGRDAKAADDVPLDADGVRLFEALRERRRELAASHGVPSFMVFHDRTLTEIARARPASLEALALVHGVGPAKREAYGQAVLDVVARAGGVAGS